MHCHVKLLVGTCCSDGNSSVLCGDLDGEDGVAAELTEGGDICIHIADSLHCTAETNQML